MATIEEIEEKLNVGINLANDIQKFVKDQDHIARQEERERCFSIAKQHLCAMCGYSECEYADCLKHCNNTNDCEFVVELCKEINEGGTENE